MSLSQRCSLKSLLAIPFLLVILCADKNAQKGELGKVDFPTSGSEKAQRHFLRGVAALHSFWFEEALEAFRESTQAEPDFMMGYWGEAMAHNHPLWSEQDTQAARKVLEKIKDTSRLTSRERAYLTVVKILYGEGDKLARDRAYAAAMEKLYRDYPDDLEAACFYSLALLGTVRPGDKGYGRQMRAAAIALKVYRQNPNHPGAAHYIIHAFDDPEHAILALPAARRYAEIAPEAHHARHMPSHIFVQLGMWPETVASNESSWTASSEWVKRKGLSITEQDYHSLQWLLYGYLQQGRYRKAEDLLSLMSQLVKKSGNDSGMKSSYTRMAGVFVAETERWDIAARLLPQTETKVEEKDGSTGAHAQHSVTQKPTSQSDTNTYRPRKSGVRPFILGLASANGKLAEADKSLAEMQVLRKELIDSQEDYGAKRMQIMELEINALASSSKGSYKEAIEAMKKAMALEEEMFPPSGPPELIKPSHELFGESSYARANPRKPRSNSPLPCSGNRIGHVRC
jgi:tetratricopeptide (TPR) repeat protein